MCNSSRSAFTRKCTVLLERGEAAISSSCDSEPALQPGLAWQGATRGKVQRVCKAMINLYAAGAHGQSQAMFGAKNYEPCAVGHHVA